MGRADWTYKTTDTPEIATKTLLLWAVIYGNLLIWRDIPKGTGEPGPYPATVCPIETAPHGLYRHQQ